MDAQYLYLSGSFFNFFDKNYIIKQSNPKEMDSRTP